MIIASAFTGCTPQPPRSAKSVKSEAEAISTVPLRLWIVSQVSDGSLVERQWRTGSEQPLEIRVLSVSDFLAEPTCACDIVAFPSRLLGELLDRAWVIKLPTALRQPVSAEESGNVQPAMWQKEVAYNGEIWGVPLGTSIPLVVVGSSEPAKSLSNQSWDEFLRSMQITAAEPIQVDAATVDQVALVDRFFAIVGGLVTRSPDYGLLFELQTMKPRLTEPEFVKAAEILAQLSSQGVDKEGSDRSAVGSFSESWAWVSSQSSPAVAIAIPSMLTTEVVKESNCRPVRVPPNGITWNTGSGLMASMSANCRQSTRATALLRWLGSSETRQALAPLILGIESAVSISGTDSSAWQAAELTREMAAGERVTSELRLARAEEYRQVLANHLLDVISGNATATEALAATSEAWQAITESRGRLVQRADYERSLGLSRD